MLDPSVTLDAAQLALSGRIRLRDGCGRGAEDVVTELWQRHFGPSSSDDAASEPDRADPDGADQDGAHQGKA